MKKIMILLLAVAFSNVSSAQTAGVVLSEKAGWHKIADRHVAFKTDRDEVIVVGNDHFKQVKLKVKDAPIYLTSFDVYYENGTTKNIEVKKTLAAGEETAATDIDNTKSIKKVVLIYRTTGAKTVVTENKKGESEKETEKERAEVEIWGMK